MKVQGTNGYAQSDSEGNWQFYDNEDNSIMAIGQDFLPDLESSTVDLMFTLQTRGVQQGMQAGAQQNMKNIGNTISAISGVAGITTQLQAIVQQLSTLNGLLAAFAPAPKTPAKKQKPAKKKNK